MSTVEAPPETLLQRIRNAVSVAIMSVLVGGAFFAFLGFAWTFRTTAWALHWVRHPLGG